MSGALSPSGSIVCTSCKKCFCQGSLLHDLGRAGMASRTTPGIQNNSCITLTSYQVSCGHTVIQRSHLAVYHYIDPFVGAGKEFEQGATSWLLAVVTRLALRNEYMRVQWARQPLRQLLLGEARECSTLAGLPAATRRRRGVFVRFESLCVFQKVRVQFGHRSEKQNPPLPQRGSLEPDEMLATAPILEVIWKSPLTSTMGFTPQQ